MSFSYLIIRNVLILLLLFSNNNGIVFAKSTTKNTRLTWVNGIGYNLEHMEKEKEFISNYFGGECVEYGFNPTSMKNTEDTWGYAADLTQATTQKYFGRVTDEVNALVQHLREAVSDVGEKGRVVHIAHSQGALVTYLAAEQLSPSVLNKIEVIAFGGAAAIRKTKNMPFHRVINYYATNDPLLLVVPPAAQALKSGFNDNEFCFLVPRLGNPIHDHALLGPTYAQALEWEGKRYQTQYQSLFYRSVRRPLSLFVLAIIHAFLLNLRALIKKILQDIVLPLLTAFAGAYHLLQRAGEHFSEAIQRFVVRPIVTFWIAFITVFYNIIMQKKEGEEYQPAQIALDLAATTMTTKKKNDVEKKKKKRESSIK